MRRKNGFVAQLMYKDYFAGRAYYLLQENHKCGQDKDMPICVVFFPIAESMGDGTAIWRPIRNGRKGRYSILKSEKRRGAAQ